MTSPFSPRSRIVLGIRLGIVRSLKAVMPASVRLHLWVLWRRLKRWPSVPVGSVDFGNLRRLVPINREFGFDRGQPVDRYYIENYLARHAEEIRGRVLEIGDNVYTRRFGGSRVAKSDVLHVSGDSPRATIVADLTNAGHAPGGVSTGTSQRVRPVSCSKRYSPLPMSRWKPMAMFFQQSRHCTVLQRGSFSRRSSTFMIPISRSSLRAGRGNRTALPPARRR